MSRTLCLQPFLLTRVSNQPLTSKLQLTIGSTAPVAQSYAAFFQHKSQVFFFFKLLNPVTKNGQFFIIEASPFPLQAHPFFLGRYRFSTTAAGVPLR